MCERSWYRWQYSSLVLLPKPLIFWWKICRDLFCGIWNLWFSPPFQSCLFFADGCPQKIISSCYRYLSTPSWSFHHLLSTVIIFCLNTIILYFCGISSFPNSIFCFPWAFIVFVSSFHFMMMNMCFHLVSCEFLLITVEFLLYRL